MRLRAALAGEATTIWYESPQRIRAALADLDAVAPDARVFLGSRIHQAARAATLGNAGGSRGGARRAGPRRGRVRDRPATGQRRPPSRPRPRRGQIDALLAEGRPRRRGRQAARRARLGDRRELYARARRARKAARGKGAALTAGRDGLDVPRLLRHHADLLHQRQPAHRPRLHDDGRPTCSRARRGRTAPAFLLTGTDEHGQKVANAAAAAGKTPQEWCDELVPRWKALFAAYHVPYDDFIRTTEPRHETQGAARVRTDARERRRLSRQVRGLVLRRRRDVLARVEARRRPLPDLRARSAVALGRRLVLPALRLSRPAARVLPRAIRDGCGRTASTTR